MVINMAVPVYFTRDITPEKVIELYKRLGHELKGNVAVKLHSGERGNQNFLRPEFWRPMIEYVKGTPVECNTAYDGARNTTSKHLDLLKKHGWTEHFDMELMDAEDPDSVLDIPNGRVIKKNYVGKGMDKYDSMLVLAHFKGHPMGGFGGALKQISIGVASAYGKKNIHGGGHPEGNYFGTEQDLFLASMADAASSVAKHFGEDILYINVMKNLSVDCDCCEVAEDPCMKDIGMLASTDPVAIDRACLDLIYKSDDPGREHFIERVTSRHGEYTIECAEALGVGTTEYELIEI